jgi:[ribosomal protein S5]-alanine N-acetyltransferase
VFGAAVRATDTIVCESRRLLLRELSLDDAAMLSELYFDPLVVQFLKKGAVFSPQELRDFIADNQRHYRRHGYGRWAVVERDTGQVIGCCGISKNEDGEIVTTCHLVRRRWNCGYGTEALAASIDFVRTHLPNTRELYAYIDVNNRPSLHVVARAGFEIVGQVRDDRRTKFRCRLCLRSS